MTILSYLVQGSLSCMVMAGFTILDTLDMECKFYPYSYKYEPDIVPLVNKIKALNHLNDNTYIPGVNQALIILEEEISLLCWSLMRVNGFIFEDCPTQFETEGKWSRNYIVYPKGDLEIPLGLSGVISYPPVRTPRKEELLPCAEIESKIVDFTEDSNDDDHEKEELSISINQYVMRHRDSTAINASG